MNKFIHGLQGLLVFVVVFLSSTVVHADGGFTYTRTPNGSIIPNPVTIRIQGIFGVDFCNSASNAYFITLNHNGPSNGTEQDDSGLLQVGVAVDRTFTFGNLPQDTYTSVTMICVGQGFSFSRILENSPFSISNPLTITTTSLPQTTVGDSYSQNIKLINAVAPTTWSISAGALPSGLSIDSSTGVISGTATAGGTFNFTVQVIDANSHVATQVLSIIVRPLGFTDVGTNIVVAPATTDGNNNSISPSPITLTFADVTSNGITSATVSSTGTTPSSGFRVGTPPTYFDISTTAIFTGTVAVCIDYSGVSYHNESTIKLMHYDSTNGLWTNITTSLDTTNNIVCGSATSFSPFAVFEEQPTPVLTPIGDKIINEGQPLTFTVNATDPEGNPLTYTATNLPMGATFDPVTKTFTWTPAYDQAGSYPNIEFTVTNGLSPVVSEDITITVNNVNRAPVLTSIGNKSVNEGQTLTFSIATTDPDGDALTYSATNLPTGSTFDPQTRTFSWTPAYGQAGNYPNVEFTVTDDGSPMMLAFEDITITVGHVNRAPIFSPVGPQQVLEHNTLTFTVAATDPDGDAVTFSATGMPSGATFNPATGLFSWTPGYPTAGVYTPTFVATDNGTPVATSSVDVVIAVGSNPTPTEQSQTLVNTVVATNLPNNLTNSYLANLNKVGTFVDQGKVQAAINQLNAFIQKVNQDYSQGKITLAEKDEFVTLAQNLINALQ